LSKALTNPARPFAAVIGGAKISSKIGVLRNLLGRLDCLIIGGGMASTLLKAGGVNVGKSLVEDDQLDVARQIMRQADERGVPLLLPSDAVVAGEFAPDAEAETVPIQSVPPEMMVLDIGPDSIESFREALEDCKTVVWNGTLGVAEFPRFATGSVEMAKTLAALDAVTIVGGGETVALVQETGLGDKFTHVSTGGGASLEFLEGKTLPGVAVLMDKT
jgi:phosphoglycerate kinase